MKQCAFIIIFIGLFLTHMQYCTTDESPQQPTTGNFANIQQPSPNFSFGQNIVPEKMALFYISVFQDNVAHKNLVTFYPEFVYGITNFIDLYVTLPIFLTTTLDCPNGGVGDLLVQLEYAFYQRTTSSYSFQATIVGNITVPTAHISSVPTDLITPPIGFDAPSFFVGLTASYLSPQWYAYIAPGATITTPSKVHTKFGDTFIVQAGVGYNLGNPGDITLLGYLEISEEYTQSTKTSSIKDPNSGGNTVYLGPSIFATKERWTFWGGIQAPIVQSLHGQQSKERYRTLFSFAVTF